MSDMDEFFGKPPEYDHPTLRRWLRKRKEVGDARVDFRRERDGLSFGPATLHALFINPAGEEVDSESEPWDDNFNLALVDNRFRATDASNEVKRFAFMLRHMFQPIEVRYGDGYFNSVLLEVIRDSALSQYPSIAAVLTDIHTYGASRSSSSYVDCVERIKAVISRCAQLLVHLGYKRGSARTFLESTPEQDDAAEIGACPRRC